MSSAASARAALATSSRLFDASSPNTIADPDVHQRRIILEGAIPSPQNRPQGCPFATRCPRKVGAICDTTPPPTQTTATGHRIFCHIPLDDLKKVDKVVVA